MNFYLPIKDKYTLKVDMKVVWELEKRMVTSIISGFPSAALPFFCVVLNIPAIKMPGYLTSSCIYPVAWE